MQVIEGTGGLTALGEDEKQGIGQTIKEEVLNGAPIAFVRRRSLPMGHLRVRGESAVGTTRWPASA